MLKNKNFKLAIMASTLLLHFYCKFNLDKSNDGEMGSSLLYMLLFFFIFIYIILFILGLWNMNKIWVVFLVIFTTEILSVFTFYSIFL